MGVRKINVLQKTLYLSPSPGNHLHIPRILEVIFDTSSPSPSTLGPSPSPVDSTSKIYFSYSTARMPGRMAHLDPSGPSTVKSPQWSFRIIKQLMLYNPSLILIVLRRRFRNPQHGFRFYVIRPPFPFSSHSTHHLCNPAGTAFFKPQRLAEFPLPQFSLSTGSTLWGPLLSVKPTNPLISSTPQTKLGPVPLLYREVSCAFLLYHLWQLERFISLDNYLLHISLPRCPVTCIRAKIRSVSFTLSDPGLDTLCRINNFVERVE